VAVRSKVNIVEMLTLCAGFILAGILGKYFAPYVGWWAWLPALLIGLLLAFLAGVSSLRPTLEWRGGERRKNRR